MHHLDKRIEHAGENIIRLSELIVEEVDSFQKVYEEGGGEQVVMRVEGARNSLILLLGSLTGKDQKDIEKML